MFRKLLSRSKTNLKTNTPIVIVSGLPRSGTSMMMKMLADGGLSVYTDNQRKADEDNPNGYFELEVVKQLKNGKFDWIENAHGKVVKVISYFLEFLPQEFKYRIIFVERNILEVLVSQKKMLNNRKEKNSISDEELIEQYKEHLYAVKYWLARQSNMRTLYIDHHAVLTDPSAVIGTIIDFLDMELDVAAMLKVPDKSLYRNRAKS